MEVNAIESKLISFNISLINKLIVPNDPIYKLDDRFKIRIPKEVGEFIDLEPIEDGEMSDFYKQLELIFDYVFASAWRYLTYLSDNKSGDSRPTNPVGIYTYFEQMYKIYKEADICLKYAIIQHIENAGEYIYENTDYRSSMYYIIKQAQPLNSLVCVDGVLNDADENGLYDFEHIVRMMMGWFENVTDFDNYVSLKFIIPSSIKDIITH